jgi:hypothetical protein
LLQLVLHALQQPVFILDHLQQLQDDLAQDGRVFRELVGIGDPFTSL